MRTEIWLPTPEGPRAYRYERVRLDRSGSGRPRLRVSTRNGIHVLHVRSWVPRYVFVPWSAWDSYVRTA